MLTNFPEFVKPFVASNISEKMYCADRLNAANFNLAVSFLRSEATLALPMGELAAPKGAD